jgi:mRNA-degrading endonuclease RelE of RelBE toxin-antitoxin system
MSDSTPRQIRLTPEFKHRLKKLAKKYPQVRTDIEAILERISAGEALGDRITGIGFPVFKVRVKNSDNQKGKSGGYRLIYWLQLK